MFHNAHLDCLPPQWTFDDLLAEKQKVKILEEELRHVRQAHARLKGLVAAQRRREAAVFSADFTELWPATALGRQQKHRALRLVQNALTAACAEWGAEYVTEEFVDGRTSRTGRSSAGRPGTPGVDAPEADAAWLLPPATRGIAEAACREVAED